MSAQDAFREMEANGVHKQGQPTAAAAPDQKQQEKEAKVEEKALPKLSAAEFRVYKKVMRSTTLLWYSLLSGQTGSLQ